jgi:acyl phosphate:glycerol-3-phosphate acyltransferase
MTNNIGLLLLACYLLGSIPSGYIIGKGWKGVDIREHGSKNMGATNALRVLGTKIGLITLLMDVLKGFAAVHLVKAIVPNSPDLYFILAGLAAIIGHIFTIFLRFKGGKGVATSAGVFIGLIPMSVGIALLVFLITVAISKYVSLGSILAALSLLIVQFYYTWKAEFQQLEYLIFVAVICVFIIFKHKENIKRLIAGNENKLQLKK